MYNAFKFTAIKCTAVRCNAKRYINIQDTAFKKTAVITIVEYFREKDQVLCCLIQSNYL